MWEPETKRYRKFVFLSPKEAHNIQKRENLGQHSCYRGSFYSHACLKDKDRIQNKICHRPNHNRTHTDGGISLRIDIGIHPC